MANISIEVKPQTVYRIEVFSEDRPNRKAWLWYQIPPYKTHFSDPEFAYICEYVLADVKAADLEDALKSKPLPCYIRKDVLQYWINWVECEVRIAYTPF